MKYLILISLFSLFTSCQGQSGNERTVGGTCEGCEALMDFTGKKLSPIDTLPNFSKNEPKLHLSGTVYEKDGKTPAENVIIYIYHTDRAGIYSKSENAKGWESRHGMHRGWVKTKKDGRYDFYTFRPAAYPGNTLPQHIHMTVKEPNTIPYYIDDIFFDDDPNLPGRIRNSDGKRGGSGIVIPVKSTHEDIYEIRRDIFLGKNIPNY